MDLTAEERTKLLAIYELYGKLMHLIALEYFNGNVELANDCVQDSFERIAIYINNIGEPHSKSTKAYVRKIVQTIALNMIKREARNECLDSKELESRINSKSSQRDFADKSTNLQMKEFLNEMLESLTEEEKILIWYRYQEVPYKEIAKKMAVTESTLRKRMERIKRKLIRYRKCTGIEQEGLYG